MSNLTEEICLKCRTEAIAAADVVVAIRGGGTNEARNDLVLRASENAELRTRLLCFGICKAVSVASQRYHNARAAMSST